MIIAPYLFLYYVGVVISILLIQLVDSTGENFKPYDPPRGTKEDWIEGIEKGDLYERLRNDLHHEIAYRKSSEVDIVTAKEISENPLKKSVILKILKEDRDHVLAVKDKYDSKRITDTIKLIDDGIAEIEKLPDVINATGFKKHMKKFLLKIIRFAKNLAIDTYDGAAYFVHNISKAMSKIKKLG